MEPVVSAPGDPAGLTEADLQVVMQQYELLAEKMLEQDKKGDPFTFYHYMIDLTGGPCIYKRISGCGSGTEYMAVTPWGDLYPCHQFVGEEKFKLGDIWQGVTNEEAQATLAARKKEIAEASVADAKARVEANPTDAQLQFKYGQALFDAEQYTEAIAPLQRARTNPNLRIKSMLMLGKCYAAKNMTDMAIRQLEDANKEVIAMDDTKKEILYMIGSLYESAGNTEKAVENFKVIYEVDYGYRDVAQKVESAYS
jgi:tetratricopeptide (TPR) repeat protein